MDKWPHPYCYGQTIKMVIENHNRQVFRSQYVGER